MAELNLTNPTADYGKDAIVTLSPREHIRLRPGMYIGKLGDGTQTDDGIYVLLKEVVDNSIDEFIMGAGKRIEIRIEDDKVSVRDYGRGIPLLCMWLHSCIMQYHVCASSRKGCSHSYACLATGFVDGCCRHTEWH